MLTFELKDIETGYEELLRLVDDGLTVLGALITFLGSPWDEDVMVWGCGLRSDMLKLAWQKRKLDLAKELEGSIAAAYEPPVGSGMLVKRFGPPKGVRVELVT